MHDKLYMSNAPISRGRISDECDDRLYIGLCCTLINELYNGYTCSVQLLHAQQGRLIQRAHWARVPSLKRPQAVADNFFNRVKPCLFTDLSSLYSLRPILSFRIISDSQNYSPSLTQPVYLRQTGRSRGPLPHTYCLKIIIIMITSIA
jgi:hypothetical protein